MGESKKPDILDSAKSPEEVAKQIEQLSTEEAALFLKLVEQALKKRRILLFGNLLALIFLVGGMLSALYIYAHREPGQFIVWVFLVPFLLVGATLFICGRWARRM
ncbi:MAG: hypothetical protein AAGC55_00525 [Myxococcota bacterium]